MKSLKNLKQNNKNKQNLKNPSKKQKNMDFRTIETPFPSFQNPLFFRFFFVFNDFLSFLVFYCYVEGFS